MEVYNAATAVWQELEKLITEGIQASGNICSNEINQRSIWMTYWATHQRFFRSLCLALKVRTSFVPLDVLLGRIRRQIDPKEIGRRILRRCGFTIDRRSGIEFTRLVRWRFDR